MQVKNGDIWQAKEALTELMKEVLPVKTAYWLAKLARKCSEQLRDIETVRVKLVQEYGVQDDKGQFAVQPGSEQWVKFANAFEELMAETVEIEGIDHKIVLPSDNGLCVSATTLMNLEALVEVA